MCAGASFGDSRMRCHRARRRCEVDSSALGTDDTSLTRRRQGIVSGGERCRDSVIETWNTAVQYCASCWFSGMSKFRRPLTQCISPVWLSMLLVAHHHNYLNIAYDTREIRTLRVTIIIYNYSESFATESYWLTWGWAKERINNDIIVPRHGTRNSQARTGNQL